MGVRLNSYVPFILRTPKSLISVLKYVVSSSLFPLALVGGANYK